MNETSNSTTVNRLAKCSAVDDAASELGLGEGDGVGLGDGDGLGLGEGDGLGDGVGLGEGDGLGLGLGEGVPAHETVRAVCDPAPSV